MANINLSFTVVNTGAVKGASQFTSFEVHATGCKDLDGLIRGNLPPAEPGAPARNFADDAQLPGGFWIEQALNVAAAIESSLGDATNSGDLRGMGYQTKDFKVCSCCSLKRMTAAGRVPPGYTGQPAAEEVVLVVDEELTAALRQLAQDRTDEVIAELQSEGVE